MTICVILFGSINTMTAQVKLQTNNVDEVLKAMTLEEKAMLVVGGNRQIATSGEYNGMIGGHAQRVPGAAGATQSIPRLGIPSTVLTDGPAGVRISPRRDNDTNTYFCTGFPVGTALACTWNTQLVEEVGKCIGKEVVELYVSAPAGGLEKPACELKAFAKTRELQPNQSETLTMKLSLYDLASYNEATQAWETAPGKYTIGFGANVENIRATAPYSLSKQFTVKCHDVMKPNM